MKNKISVVIPIKDGIDTIKECIEGIKNQTVIDQIEIIGIDSGSTDGTLEYIESEEIIQVIKIDPKDFNHGDTRNLGVQNCNGNLILLTVQDAILKDNSAIERMSDHFKDPNIAGVCGAQVVPHDKDKNPLEWFRPQSEPKIKKIKFKKDDFNNLSPKEKWQTCRWDDVFAMYRKSELKYIPFRKIDFGEDMAWAKDALSNELTLMYDTSIRVYHYHSYNYKQIQKRTNYVCTAIYDIFGYVRPSPYNLIDIFLRPIVLTLRYRTSLKWLIYNVIIRLGMHNEYKRFGKKHKNLYNKSNLN